MVSSASSTPGFSSASITDSEIETSSPSRVALAGCPSAAARRRFGFFSRILGVLAGLGRLFGAGIAVRGVEIDDVAQQHLVFVERVAPVDQRAHGQRAFADAADHHFAAGLDALGDRDLAFARQQLDRAHFAQIHAHRIVGAADIGLVDIAARRAARRPRCPRSSASASASSASPSSLSTTLMPSSDSMVIVSSICSEDTWSAGSAAFSSS